MRALLIVLLTACSTDRVEHLTQKDAAPDTDQDTGPGDTGERDSGTADSGADDTGLVIADPATVVVTMGDQPAAGIDVVVSRANGDLLAHLRTDQRGEASAEIEPGAMVTVASFDPALDTYELLTTTGIEPGDRVAVNLDLVPPSETITTAALILPGRFFQANGAPASGYDALAGCGGSSTSDPSISVPPLAIDARCLDDGGRFHVFARATDGGGHPLAYTLATDLVPQSPGPMSISLPPWRTDFFPIEVDVIDPPTDAFRLWATIDPARIGRGDSTEGPYPATLLVPSATSDQVELTFYA